MSDAGRRIERLRGHVVASSGAGSCGVDVAPTSYVLKLAPELPCIAPSGSLKGRTVFITGASRGCVAPVPVYRCVYVSVYGCLYLRVPSV